MTKQTESVLKERTAADGRLRRKRVDGQQKMDALLQSAVEVFAELGVDAPVRAIAERAGVGLGTVYRHFPQRSDLIVAVFQNQIDTCAAAARAIIKDHPPDKALALCMERFVELIATKRGLAKALHSGDPAYIALPTYFDTHLRPILEQALRSAIDAGLVRPIVQANDLLRATSLLSQGSAYDNREYAKLMITLIMDGLRCRTGRQLPCASGDKRLIPRRALQLRKRKEKKVSSVS